MLYMLQHAFDNLPAHQALAMERFLCRSLVKWSGHWDMPRDPVTGLVFAHRYSPNRRLGMQFAYLFPVSMSEEEAAAAALWYHEAFIRPL